MGWQTDITKKMVWNRQDCKLETKWQVIVQMVGNGGTVYAEQGPLYAVDFTEAVELATESGQFERLKEHLNYSATRLTAVWPKRFPTMAVARQFAYNPEKLANNVYNGRLGNVDGSGDGWRYRGRGLIQLTGRINYRNVGRAINRPLEDNPDLAADFDVSCDIAAYFFTSRGCVSLAEQGEFVAVRRRINGGINGLEESLKWTTALLKKLDAGEKVCG